MSNISNKELDNQYEDYICNQEKYSLYDWVKNYRTNDLIYDNYVDILKGLSPFKSKISLAFYDTLLYSGDSKNPYWASNEAFNILLSISRNKF